MTSVCISSLLKHSQLVRVSRYPHLQMSSWNHNSTASVFFLNFCIVNAMKEILSICFFSSLFKVLEWTGMGKKKKRQNILSTLYYPVHSFCLAKSWRILPSGLLAFAVKNVFNYKIFKYGPKGKNLKSTFFFFFVPNKHHLSLGCSSLMISPLSVRKIKYINV